MERILITGASGFVGRVLTHEALNAGHAVTAAYRNQPSIRACDQLRTVSIGDLAQARWDDALHGVDTVIHAAGRAHVLSTSAHGLPEFRRVNTVATRALAECAARHGVRRLVYLSSIKVNGERTLGPGHAFRETDPPRPRDAYAQSKLEAEHALSEVAAATQLEVVIVRPPLVFGAGVRANFFALMRWIDRGLPFPLGAIRNERTIVSVWNLCHLLLTCARHPAAPGQVFVAGDSRPVSTVELIDLLARGMERRAHLVPVPSALLNGVAMVLGRSEQLRRLCDSLVIDTSRTRRLLAWTPPLSLEEGLLRTARWYRDSDSAS